MGLKIYRLLCRLLRGLCPFITVDGASSVSALDTSYPRSDHVIREFGSPTTWIIKANGREVQYYPIQRHWRRIRPHLEDPELQRILVRDMRKVSPRFRPGMKPAELDGCDWRFFDGEGNPRGVAGLRRSGTTRSMPPAIGW
jgi:hypothetical protein